MALDFILKGETEHPRNVIVLLHGSGQNARDMEPAAEIFARENPDALLIIPNGPRALPNCNGFDWFNPDDLQTTAGQLAFNMKPMLDELDLLIDSQLQKHGLTDKDLALFGFSLGGMTALYAGQHRENRCAAVVCHSSVYPVAVPPRTRPSTIMVMGDSNIRSIDEDIRKGDYPANFSYRSAIARLQDQDIDVAEYVVPGLTHMTTADSLRISAGIINDSLHGGRAFQTAVLPKYNLSF
ncbi:MAG TPA: alpha/beta hydrolase-fold protein [Patescibacteria group bacterium]|jgi:phospholipase/carboxylesterase|nr:alpha/beta hydrolase-fold protein [Patescibacteria group bacterium]